ncbi:nucleoside permease [Granulicella sibirica]|uniref:Nucleoside permease NupG n=1 Tax=Granulicella sibirica TaxID=2479048 RepID=A0A4Q0SUF2_9BACT|nr:nucleoside permease [Granulicella sibirica]RXH54655.1 Nucleoside permease NupG [Granulicella sibirica]
MNMQIKVRLGIMMFLEYFIWGAWYVTVGTWLSTTLHFTGQQVGLIAGSTAVGAIVAPFFVGLIADKLFSTEKVLATLHIGGAVLLFFASRQLSFTSIYAVILLYCLCFMPTLALTNSLSFRLMSDPKIEFGPIRVLGTAGWIVAGLGIGAMKLEATTHPLEIAAAVSALMGVYCLSLPHTPPLARDGKFSIGSLFPREAIALLKERSMAVFAIASFLICIPLQFYYAFTNLFLNKTGVVNAAGKMTGGQMSELFCMLLIPWFFRRLGVKYMLAAGMFAWVLRYLLFAYGNAGPGVWMFWLGILLHGICYDFFFVTGQIYIDRKASLALRAAAQGLISFITYGLGMFVGSWLSGLVVDHYAQQGADGVVTYDWRSIWIFAAATSAVVLVLFLVTFFERESGEVRSPAAEGMEGVPL